MCVLYKVGADAPDESSLRNRFSRVAGLSRVRFQHLLNAR